MVAAAAVLAALSGEAGPPVESVPAYVADGIALTGALLGWRFGHGRAALALIVLALVYLAVSEALTGAPGPDPLGQILYPAVALLLPVNLLLIAWFGERGLVSFIGLSRLGLIAFQAGLLAILVWAAVPEVQADLAALLHRRLLPPAFDRWTYLPQPALIAFAVAGAILVGRAVLRPGPLEAALLTGLIAAGAGLQHIGAAPVPEIYLTAAIAAVTLAVVQESYHMAFLDDLTGLPGRRALGQEMKRLSGAYAVAMVDVDHFKKFNDRYGHDTGDQMLKMVAGCLARARGARAFRYGGEEFTLLYPGLDADAACEALEAVRLGVAQRQFRRRGKDRPNRPPGGARRRAGRKGGALSVTVSIGVAPRGLGGECPEEVLKAADLALYGAKRAGRNRVMPYRPRRRKRK